jgi:crotonobetainyl-CoA:carnitine CoA-transferase CaiB-like acyl-CoA transferase
VVELFERNDVPAMPYHARRGARRPAPTTPAFEIKAHPTEGAIRNMRLPNHWSCGARSEWNPAPKLGQQSVEILREAGCSDIEIERLVAAGVTVDGRLDKQ